MIGLLLTYKYFILFPLAIVEGPILTVITGPLIKSGILNLYAVYAIVVIGDVVGDTVTYSIGRFGGPILLHKFSKFFGITEEKREKAKVYFHENRHKTLILSKIIHGVGIAGIFTAGSLKIDYRRFLLICASVSVLQCAFFLFVGVLFGEAYATIAKYFDFFGKTTIVAGIIVALILFFYFRLKKV